MSTTNNSNKRILAIDILRGLTIAGMIMVNNPGSWGHLYAPLAHAEWNGLTPTDLVFPFFMFVMGMCIYIAMKKFDFTYSPITLHKIVKRMLLIYLVGIAMGWFSKFCSRLVSPLEGAEWWQQAWYMVWSFDTIRLTGVLARLSVCYGITALLAVSIRHKHIPYIILGLLVSYWCILLAGNGWAYDMTNILSVVDRYVLTEAHMYDDNGIDPEGLLSTLPAIAHTLLGFWIGKSVFSVTNGEIQAMGHAVETSLSKVLPLFIAGALLTFSGFLLSYGCPINKKIWSPTFVLISCGMASTLLAVLVWVIDVKEHRRWCKFFEVFGVNPLFLFVMSGVVSIIFRTVRWTWEGTTKNLTRFLYEDLFSPLFGEYGGSLAYALLVVGILWAMGLYLYNRKIYIKL